MVYHSFDSQSKLEVHSFNPVPPFLSQGLGIKVFYYLTDSPVLHQLQGY